MRSHKENIPDPKEIEKDISEFLSKKFKDNVKIVSPVVLHQSLALEKSESSSDSTNKINFDLLPEDLIAFLDQYIVKQDRAKAILATKICTHFNRIKRSQSRPADASGMMIGGIKNNVLMLGPTGVGKTYIIKLIAEKIGVPFVKGDATKFSETGYVGGDVEDLVRDLVREADDDTELAQYGIIYIDEIDKIAGSRDHFGADVSRTGVQRGLLKPMEETEVDLKVAHDPISMIQEIESYRKTGKRNKRVINTKNILFIMSGAFVDLPAIIRKRLNEKGIGFGAPIKNATEDLDILLHVRSEDLIKYGFESEFVGRLPVRAIFENLTEADLFEILHNPNNPIMLGKKLDFAAYGIDIKFDENALKILAHIASEENTGARGLVSAVEGVLLPFEKKLPSTVIRKFPVTERVIRQPEETLAEMIAANDSDARHSTYEELCRKEQAFIRDYLASNTGKLTENSSLTMTAERIATVANCYSRHAVDVGTAIRRIRSYHDEVKQIELYFFKNHDINIVLEEDAIDFIIEKFVTSDMHLDEFYKKLNIDFEHGLKLVREKTGKNRFFINREALLNPETYIRKSLATELNLP
jgi:endopeptidase Clp ATP-binding regulatory subunit ClpX